MAREVRVAILGDSRDWSRAVRSAQDDANKLDRAFSGIRSGAARMGKAVLLGAGAVAAGGVALAKGFIDAATESQKVTKQTEAVLKSMGNSAGVTAKQVADLSTKLSMQSGIDDELIQSGENILLTFGQVRNGVGKTNKVFDRATQAALDMSVALGTDMTSASMLVGKALNDPIRGLTALRRSGIQFTKSQEDQIRVMVEAGDVMGAQKIMLDELERQFGGSAAAQATAGEKLKVIWGNLQEQLGEKLLPVFNAVATWLGDHLPAAIDAATPYLASIAEFFESVGRAVGEFVRDRLEELGGWWDKNGPAIQKTVSSLADEFTGHVLPALESVANFIRDRVLPVLAGIATWVVTNKPVLAALATFISGVLVAAFISWAVAAGQAAIATTLATWPVLAIIAYLAVLAAGILYVSSKWNDYGSVVWKVHYALSEIRKVIEPIIAAITLFAMAVWQAVQAVGSLLSKLGSIPGALGSIGSVLGSIGSGPVSGLKALIGGLPGLAQGGVVPGAFGQPVPIIAHGGEVVTMASARNRGGGGDTIVIPVSIGGHEIERIVVDVNTRTVRRGFAA